MIPTQQVAAPPAPPSPSQVGVDLGLKERLRAVMEAAQGGGATEKRLLEVGIDVMAVLAKAT